MEIWKPLRNFPSYNGSSEGRIMNIRTQRILKTFINEKGYEKVCLRKNNQQYTVSVHKVIAETFLGEHPGMDVRHKDLDRSNNCADNLEWCTRSELISKAFERGSKLPARATRVRVIETGLIFNSVAECARALGCDKSEIFKQLAGKRENVKGLRFELA